MGSEREWSWKTCEHCNKKMRRFRITKNGEFVCFTCYRKTVTIIPERSLKYILDKPRIVRLKHENDSGFEGVIHVPGVLIGKKVRLVRINHGEALKD